MSEAIDELAQQADENETIKQMGTLDTVAMVITIAGDNGVYRVESDDRAEKCLRLLLTAMNQEGPLRMTKVAEIPPEIYEAVQAARAAAEEGTGCGECDGCKAAAAEQAPDPDETIH